MQKEERSKTGGQLPHNVILEGRERLSVSGVEDVISFDEGNVMMSTSKGMLIVKGEQLHIEKLNLDNGELSLDGMIAALDYEDGANERQGFWSRLFG